MINHSSISGIEQDLIHGSSGRVKVWVLCGYKCLCNWRKSSIGWL